MIKNMQTKQKRKWMLWCAMGLVGIAAVTLLWYKRDDVRHTLQPAVNGKLNADVPDARNDSREGWSKLDFYRHADEDSAKRKAAQTRDPYYVLPGLDTGEQVVDAAESQARQLEKQLAVLQKQLKTSESPVKKITPPPAITPFTLPAPVQRRAATKDPEIEQLDSMLDKILELQRPVQKTDIPNVNAHSASAVTNDIVHIAGDSITTKAVGFYTVSDEQPNNIQKNAFAAIIDEEQVLTSGAIIRMRLMDPMMIDGKTVSTGQLLFGTAKLEGERLQVNITHIRVGEQLLAVKLLVHDPDGLPGLYIPGAISRDVARQSADRSVSTLNIAGYDPSIGAQAANAGIHTAKTLLQKKVQQVRVTVPAGYRVLLKNI
jgi:conjugative transposon TraM protein